jgi:hypothetical protein
MDSVGRLVPRGDPAQEAAKWLPLNADSAEKITKDLTAESEWFGFAGQTLAITASALVDQVSPAGRALLWLLAALHLGLAARARWRRRGPFTSGPPWGAVWLGSALVMPVVVAFLVTPGAYGTSPACVQMCAYPAAPLVVFAFYPWGMASRRWQRLRVQFLALLGIALEPLLIIYVVNRTVTPTNWHAVVLSAFWNVLAFLGGIEVRRICRRAARKQFAILEHQYGSKKEFLHGQVNNLLRSADFLIAHDNIDGLKEKLRQLKQAIDEEHRELDTATEHVNVLHVIRQAIAAIQPALEVRRDIPTGESSVPQPIGELFADAASAMLKNVHDHTQGPATVTYRVDRDIAFLFVSDHGPGLAPTVLDDQSTNLNLLRERARELGGDLDVMWSDQIGTRMRLFVPLYEPA